MIAPTRRGFLAGLGALLAAPAIVRASSLMAVKPAILDHHLIVSGYDAYGEFATENLIVRAHEHYAIGWVDARAVYGTARGVKLFRTIEVIEPHFIEHWVPGAMPTVAIGGIGSRPRPIVAMLPAPSRPRINADLTAPCNA